MRHADFAPAAAKHDGEVHHIGVVGRIRVDDPLQEPDAASLGVASALVRALLERLPDEVGHEQCDAAGPAVLVRGPHHGLKVSLRGHVADGVVDVDRIESPPQSYRADVAPDVIAIRVQSSTHPEHPRREVYERHRKTLLQVEGAVASP